MRPIDLHTLQLIKDENEIIIDGSLYGKLWNIVPGFFIFGFCLTPFFPMLVCVILMILIPLWIFGPLIHGFCIFCQAMWIVLLFIPGRHWYYIGWAFHTKAKIDEFFTLWKEVRQLNFEELAKTEPYWMIFNPEPTREIHFIYVKKKSQCVVNSWKTIK